MSKKRVLVVGGTGYLGQHLLQGFSDINGSPYDVAFTHHSFPPPHSLLHAFPSSLAFPLDLKTGHGFDGISRRFGQVWLFFSSLDRWTQSSFSLLRKVIWIWLVIGLSFLQIWPLLSNFIQDLEIWLNNSTWNAHYCQILSRIFGIWLNNSS